MNNYIYFQGVTKRGNSKRNKTEHWTKVAKENKIIHKNFVDATAFKGIRFQTKQSFDFNIWTSLVLTIFEKNQNEIHLMYRGYGDLELN